MSKKLILIFALLFFVPLAHATITLNRVNVPAGSGSGSPITYSITSSTGNLLVIGIVADTGVTISSCTDSAGQSYVLSTGFTSTAIPSTLLAGRRRILLPIRQYLTMPILSLNLRRRAAEGSPDDAPA